MISDLDFFFNPRILNLLAWELFKIYFALLIYHSDKEKICIPWTVWVSIKLFSWKWNTVIRIPWRHCFLFNVMLPEKDFKDFVTSADSGATP